MNIEKYLKKKKNNLDIHIPDVENMWSDIQYKLNAKKVMRISIYRWIAASVLVFLLVGTLIRHEIIVQRQISTLSQINKELAEKESNYNYQVNQKWVEYTNMVGNVSVIEPILIDELRMLDTIYQNGIIDIKKTGYNERAVVILLDTYEKRLRIIEKLIYEKQKQTNYENKNRKVKI